MQRDIMSGMLTPSINLRQQHSLGGGGLGVTMTAIGKPSPTGQPPPDHRHQPQQQARHNYASHQQSIVAGHRFQCTLCPLATLSVEELQRHIQETHMSQLLAARQAQQQQQANAVLAKSQKLHARNGEVQQTINGRYAAVVAGTSGYPSPANYTSTVPGGGRGAFASPQANAAPARATPQRYADVDESVMAAANTILSISGAGLGRKASLPETATHQQQMAYGLQSARALSRAEQQLLADQQQGSTDEAASSAAAAFRPRFHTMATVAPPGYGSTSLALNSLNANGAGGSLTLQPATVAGFVQQQPVHHQSAAAATPASLLTLDDLQNLLIRQAALKAQTAQQQQQQVTPVVAATPLATEMNVSPQLAAELLNYQQSMQMLAPGTDLIEALRIFAAQQVIARAAAATQLYANYAAAAAAAAQPSPTPVAVAAPQPPQQLYLPLHNAVAAAAVGSVRNSASRQAVAATVASQLRVVAVTPPPPTSAREDVVVAAVAQQRRHSTLSAVAANNVVAQARAAAAAAAARATALPVTINTAATAAGYSASAVSVAATGPGTLSLRSPEEIDQHISRLISQNEAILEPSPLLARRRPYTRQFGAGQPTGALAAGVAAGTFGAGSSTTLGQPAPQQQQQQSSTPVLASPREYRSNSLHSSFSPGVVGGGSQPPARRNSLLMPHNAVARQDSALAAVHHDAMRRSLVIEEQDEPTAAAASNPTRKFLEQVETATMRSAVNMCRFCGLSVRHAEDVRRHEEKCVRRDTQQSIAVAVPCRGAPLKKRILAAAEHDAMVTEAASALIGDLENHSVITPPQFQSQPSTSSKRRLTLPSMLVSTTTSVINFQPYTLTYTVGSNNDRSTFNTVTRRMACSAKECFETLFTQPSYLPYADTKISLYAQRVHTRAKSEEPRLLPMLMETCEVRSLCSTPRYSVARMRDTMRVTHSTYSQYAAQLNRTLAILTQQQRQQLEQQQQLRTASAFGCYGLNVGDETTVVESSSKTPASSSPLADHRRPSIIKSEPITSPKAAAGHQPSTSRSSSISSTTRDSQAFYFRYRNISRYQRLAKIRERRLRARILESRQRRLSNVSTASTTICTESLVRNQSANDEESDETMSNDRLCVVTDDDEGTKPNEADVDSLLPELRRNLFDFSQNWEAALKSNRRWPTPFLFVGDDSPNFSETNDSFALYIDDDSLSSIVGDERPLSAPSCLFVDADWRSISQATNGCVQEEDATGDGHVRVSNLIGLINAPDILRPTPVNASASSLTSNSVAAGASPANDGIKAVCAGESSSEKECDKCGKRFRAFYLYSLHHQAHSMERSACRRYEYKCAHCSTACRSRNQLQKHMAIAHSQVFARQSQASVTASHLATGGSESVGSQTVASGAPSLIPLKVNSSPATGAPSSSSSCITSQQQQLGAAMFVTDPRPFKCQYCEIAFRIHGHLAKHLRSKAHIMKLEGLEKVPPGTFAMLEESKTDKFSQIDTSDCQNSLDSLLRLTDEMKCDKFAPNWKSSTVVADQSSLSSVRNGASTVTSSPVNNAPANVLREERSTLQQAASGPALSGAVSQPNTPSLVCMEQFRPATSPVISDNNSSPSPTVAYSGAAVPSTDAGGGRRSKTVVADVWLPPKELAGKIAGVGQQDANCAALLAARSPAPVFAPRTSSVDSGKSRSFADTTVYVLPPSSSSFSGIGSLICRFCQASFSTPVDLELHYHADHVIMRDGSFFKCPRPNCDTVYPTRQNLRNHLIHHYYGGSNGGGTTVAHQNSVSYNGTPESGVFGDPGVGTNVSRSTVTAALNRKLMNGSAELFDANGQPIRRSYCSRASSTKSNCDCYKCVKYTEAQSNCSSTLDASPGGAAPSSDSDASRLSAGSRSLTPPSPRPHSKRSLIAATTNIGGDSTTAVASVKRFRPSPTAADVGSSLAVVAGGRSRVPTPVATPPSAAIQHGHRQSYAAPAVAPQTAAFYNLLNLNNAAAFDNDNEPVSPQTATLLSAASYNAAAVCDPLAAATARQQRNAFAALAAAKSFYIGWPPAAYNAGCGDAAAADGAAVFNNKLQQPTVAAGSNERPGENAALDNLRCIKCGKQFYSATAVQQHIVSEHYNGDRRSYVCPYCDAGFTTERGLAAHAPCRLQPDEQAVCTTSTTTSQQAAVASE